MPANIWRSQSVIAHAVTMDGPAICRRPPTLSDAVLHMPQVPRCRGLPSPCRALLELRPRAALSAANPLTFLQKRPCDVMRAWRCPALRWPCRVRPMRLPLPTPSTKGHAMVPQDAFVVQRQKKHTVSNDTPRALRFPGLRLPCRALPRPLPRPSPAARCTLSGPAAAAPLPRQSYLHGKMSS